MQLFTDGLSDWFANCDKNVFIIFSYFLHQRYKSLHKIAFQVKQVTTYVIVFVILSSLVEQNTLGTYP